MVLTIGGKEYKFKFSIEASLCEECVAKTTEFMYLSYEAQTGDDLRKAISESMSSISSTALSMFYAGLLENHGDEIRSKADAKDLVKKYFEENAESDDANWYGLLNTMIAQMGEDGFFKLIGLEQLIKNAEGNQTEIVEIAKKPTRRSTTATKR